MLPTLYTFRRCPYAIRARMALFYSKIPFYKHEVDLKNKPASMLDVSPKGTVPVLVLPDNQILEESLDIMLYALKQNDPLQWLWQSTREQETAKQLIENNDNEFKFHLDRYKYPKRYENCEMEHHKNEVRKYFIKYDNILQKSANLLSERTTIADIAIFPFIRQAVNTNKDWFASLELTNINQWLSGHLNSELFTQVMQKS